MIYSHKLLIIIIMSSNAYYAVHKGHSVGIFLHWIDCKKQITDYKCASYKKFDNIIDAEDFVRNGNKSQIADEKYFVLKGVKEFDENSYYLLKFDGGANPNPGPTSGGAVIFEPLNETNKRVKIIDIGLFLKTGTNNIGEYNGLKIGLEEAIRNNIKNLVIHGDSKLVVYQVNKKWKINNEYIKSIHDEIMTLLNRFDNIAIKHVYRENNIESDAICNEVLSLEHDIYRKYL